MTIAFSPVVYFFLIDSPDKAPFLTDDERVLAVERLRLTDSTAQRGVSWPQVSAALTDYKNYAHALMHFCANFSFAALSNFLPTIVRDMGFDRVSAQGLTAPAYFTAYLVCVATSCLSDRYGKRGFFVAGAAAMAAVGYGLLAGVQDEHSTAPRYAAVWLAACGAFPALSLNVTWLLNNQGGDSKKGAGLAVVLMVGQCSSFVASSVFPKSDG